MRYTVWLPVAFAVAMQIASFGGAALGTCVLDAVTLGRGSSAQEVQLEAGDAPTSDAAGAFPASRQQESSMTIRDVLDRELASDKREARQRKAELAERLQVAREAALSPVVVNGGPISQRRMREIGALSVDYTLQVEFVYQYEVLPAGCEIMALSATLRALGFEADPVRIADEYLRYGSDPATDYTGSPHVDGGGFAPCIVDAANAWLRDEGGGAVALDITGTPFSGVRALAAAGLPVLVWTTEAMAEPITYDGWYFPEHCVVYCGDDAQGSALVCDSIAGEVVRNASDFEHIYDACGRRAAFVQPIAQGT